MQTKRVVRCDSREFRIDEAAFREDFMQKNKNSLLFAEGARVGAFLHDSAHVTASGVFPYADGKGGIRMEYRPAEEVKDELFLDSLQGIPLTLLHPKDTKSAPGSIIGMVKTRGIAEDSGDARTVGVRSEVVVHDAETVTATTVRGLSLGFSCDLIEEPGLTPWGEKYDAIQRNLRADHLAVVPNPRVKSARINLDEDDTNEGRPKMPKVRLDSGLEYEAADEVIHELTRVKGEISTLSAKADSAEADKAKLQAQVDTLQAKADSLEASIPNLKEDAKAEAFAAAKARIALESVAESHGVKVKADASDNDLMVAVIKAVRGDAFDLTGKNDAYVQAAYDLAVQDKSGAPARRTMIHGDSHEPTGEKPNSNRNDSQEKSAASSAGSMFDGLN